VYNISNRGGHPQNTFPATPAVQHANKRKTW